MVAITRLVAIIPMQDSIKPRFKLWRAERSSGKTVTMSCDFDDVTAATAVGRALPYVWHLENLVGS